MLIGINGFLQSGKDTACKILTELSEQEDSPVSGYTIKRDAFADRLKISAARALGWGKPGEDCIAFCNELKKDGVTITVTENYVITGREYLQNYGTEAHRDVFGQDFWVSAVIPSQSDWKHYGRKDLQKLENPVLVITDVRFPNEAEAVLQAGGEVWYIAREEAEKRAKKAAHASENPLPANRITRYVDNNKDLDWFAEQIKAAFEGMKND